MAQLFENDIGDLIDLIDRRAAGVKVHLSRTPDGVVFIHLIEVPPTQRGFGLGRRVLDLICQTADALGWTLRLHPSGDFGSDYGRLVRWYAASGFVPGRVRAERDMVRVPEVVDHWIAVA
jgi:GNAT superfamily N-acetyltransferase